MRHDRCATAQETTDRLLRRYLFSLTPEVCDVDARVEAHALVLLRIGDEAIEQLAHSGSAADVNVAGVTELHRLPLRFFVSGIERVLQLL